MTDDAFSAPRIAHKTVSDLLTDVFLFSFFPPRTLSPPPLSLLHCARAPATAALTAKEWIRITCSDNSTTANATVSFSSETLCADVARIVARKTFTHGGGGGEKATDDEVRRQTGGARLGSLYFGLPQV